MYEAELEERWSFVGTKKAPRWLWHALEHPTGTVLAYVFGCRTDEVFWALQRLLEPFGITRYYTDYWGAYARHLDRRNIAPASTIPSKSNASTWDLSQLCI